ncbi:MAG: NRDE family protein [Saprospiraceae bacterium]|nr:NRDE family protein [Saprospiraceae bacterium]
MCTITYIPSVKPGHFVVTDNRDEAVSRPALPPALYKEPDSLLFYPKDIQAGGTWIGMSSQNRLMALMNGAFERHQRLASYRKSRGTVVKELLIAADLSSALKYYDFTGIEQFYGLIFSWSKKMQILEVVWDGTEVHIQSNNPDIPQIWSAAMTYSPQQKQDRQQLFNAFLLNEDNEENIADAIWNFHKYTGDGDKEGMVIDRGFLKTTSITQFYFNPHKQTSYKYLNILTRKESLGYINWNILP